MPRRSAESLAVVSTLAEYRPAPPDGLTPDQAAVWSDTVSRMPPNWFPRETHELLANYCKHVTTARLLSRLIDGFKPEWLSDPDGLPRLDKLTLLRDREVKGMANLARQMRVTQLSRYRGETAANAIRKEPMSGPRPWETSRRG
jgi:hypothetical protein